MRFRIKHLGNVLGHYGARSIVVLLAALLAFTAKPAGAETPRQYLVGFVGDNFANDYHAAIGRDLQRRFARHAHIRYLQVDSGGQTPRQIANVEDMLARKASVILIHARDAKALAPVLTRAHRSGVPVVLLLRAIASEEYTALVGPDDGEIGATAARVLAERLQGRGRIFMLRGTPTATTAQLRTRHFLEELKRFPEMRVVAVRDANYLRADAIRAVEEVAAKGIAFDAIYAQSDSMAAGARLALRKLGRDPAKIPTVGVDYIREARAAIAKGEQYASLTYPNGADEAVELTVQVLAGKTVPRRVVIPSVTVTADNQLLVEPLF